MTGRSTFEISALDDRAFHAQIVAIAQQAGDSILEIYNSDDFGVREKVDRSPVTRADLAAHSVIVDSLQRLTPQVPVVSEEDSAQEGNIGVGDIFWLVDPVDGTAEFIGRSGDFTVNIALVYKSEPVFGVVFAPVHQLIYWGGPGRGAWRRHGGEGGAVKLDSLRAGRCDRSTHIVASSGNLNAATRSFISKFPDARLKLVGSSLKICMVADGQADMYPRMAPTCEWDTAAGDAILRGADGALFGIDGRTLDYGKASITNPRFIGLGVANRAWFGKQQFADWQQAADRLACRFRYPGATPS